MSAPHDLFGRPFCRGDIVIVPYNNHVCGGVVSDVFYETGSVLVQSVMITRDPEIEPVHVLFPATQLVIIDKCVLTKPELEEQRMLLDLHEHWK